MDMALDLVDFITELMPVMDLEVIRMETVPITALLRLPEDYLADYQIIEIILLLIIVAEILLQQLDLKLRMYQIPVERLRPVLLPLQLIVPLTVLPVQAGLPQAIVPIT